MKWWTGIIAVVCGAELIVAAAIGGAGIGAFFGLDGAFVAALAAATLAFSVRSWLTARRRSRPAQVSFDHRPAWSDGAGGGHVPSVMHSIASRKRRSR